MKFGILIAASLIASSAFAQQKSAKVDLWVVGQRVAEVKSIIAPGQELAGAYARYFNEETKTMDYKLQTGDDYLNTVQASFLFMDVNHDGQDDLVVAVEAPPQLSHAGFVFAGARTLQIYLGDGHGHYVLKSEASKTMLSAEDGGIFGDPWTGLSARKNGAFEVSFYGGSADRWSLNLIYQYRQDDFYLIGRLVTEYNDITMAGQTTDINFVTGKQILTVMRGYDDHGKALGDRVKQSYLPRKPLTRMVDVSAGDSL